MPGYCAVGEIAAGSKCSDAGLDCGPVGDNRFNGADCLNRVRHLACSLLVAAPKHPRELAKDRDWDCQHGCFREQRLGCSGLIGIVPQDGAQQDVRVQ
ncbi:MAG: hypothetical protein OXE83_15955 [Gammaproteobacteria bacterium]|nr:hypothetical protein [Gammaproteobacteria bacterium]